MHPGGVNLRYSKIRIFDLTEFMVSNIKSIMTFRCKDIGTNKQSLRQELSFFTYKNFKTVKQQIRSSQLVKNLLRFILFCRLIVSQYEMQEKKQLE